MAKTNVAMSAGSCGECAHEEHTQIRMLSNSCPLAVVSHGTIYSVVMKVLTGFA